MNEAYAHSNGSALSTKEKILNAAERLFAENGFQATSLRDITREAGVNLAAINYHFHSKDDLIRAIYSRHIVQVNRRRLELLEAELAAAQGRPSLENLIRAFIEPAIALRATTRGAYIGKLFGRTHVETSPVVRATLHDLMKPVARPFMEAFRRALPELPLPELLWRMHFAVGAMSHTLAGAEHLETLSAGLCKLTDVEAATKRLVTFIAAGLRAEVPSEFSTGVSTK